MQKQMPILGSSYLEGRFYTLYEKLRDDDSKFFNYFHMSVITFDFAVEHIAHSIEHQDTRWRACILPKEMFAVTIRWVKVNKPIFINE